MTGLVRFKSFVFSYEGEGIDEPNTKAEYNGRTIVEHLTGSKGAFAQLLLLLNSNGTSVRKNFEALMLRNTALERSFVAKLISNGDLQNLEAVRKLFPRVIDIVFKQNKQLFNSLESALDVHQVDECAAWALENGARPKINSRMQKLFCAQGYVRTVEKLVRLMPRKAKMPTVVFRNFVQPREARRADLACFSELIGKLRSILNVPMFHYAVEGILQAARHLALSSREEKLFLEDQTKFLEALIKNRYHPWSVNGKEQVALAIARDLYLELRGSPLVEKVMDVMLRVILSRADSSNKEAFGLLLDIYQKPQKLNEFGKLLLDRGAEVNVDIRGYPLFHHLIGFKCYDLARAIFSSKRMDKTFGNSVLCLFNFSNTYEPCVNFLTPFEGKARRFPGLLNEAIKTLFQMPCPRNLEMSRSIALFVHRMLKMGWNANMRLKESLPFQLALRCWHKNDYSDHLRPALERIFYATTMDDAFAIDLVQDEEALAAYMRFASLSLYRPL